MNSRERQNARQWSCTLLLAGLAAISAWGADAGGLVGEGRKLFEHEFAPGESATVGGDGLGPVFNHRSCVACHGQGSVGGAGPIDVNAVMLSVDAAIPARLPPGQIPDQKTILAGLRQIHVGFVSDKQEISPNIVLHRFGTRGDYDRRRSLLGGDDVPLELAGHERDQLQRQLSREPHKHVPAPGIFVLTLSQRNATALFGAGAIDQIPAAALEALAVDQERRGAVSGRVPPIGLEGVGRFGWRGQIERLHDFVIGACANELGLEVPGASQPRDPTQPNYRPTGLDLTAAQCVSLTAFVASLPPPKFVAPPDSQRREIVYHGRTMFGVIGCAACHVERIGPVDGLYSDLLLHDMGPMLTDPVPAEATFVFKSERPLRPGQIEKPSESIPQPIRQSRGYNGGSSLVNLLSPPQTSLIAIHPKTKIRSEFQALPTNQRQEWRTPPLWGVADSAPYLHDGRAATLIEAIALHGGEADAIARRFLELPIADRMAVLEFLGCLRAP